jgi:hypothetical protein
MGRLLPVIMFPGCNSQGTLAALAGGLPLAVRNTVLPVNPRPRRRCGVAVEPKYAKEDRPAGGLLRQEAVDALLRRAEIVELLELC